MVGVCTYFTCSCLLRLCVFSRESADAQDGRSSVQWTDMLKKVSTVGMVLPCFSLSANFRSLFLVSNAAVTVLIFGLIRA